MSDLMEILDRARRSLSMLRGDGVPDPATSAPGTPAPGTEESESDRIDRVLADKMPQSSRSTRLGEAMHSGVDSFWNTVAPYLATKVPGLSQVHDLASRGADYVDQSLTSSGMDSPVGARARLFGGQLAHDVADMIPSTVGGAAMLAAPAGVAKVLKPGARMLGRAAEMIGDTPLPEFGGAAGPKLLGAYESSGGNVDALDSRLASRPQGTFSTDTNEPRTFLRSTEPSGAGVDPLDSRFGARRQGVVPGDTSEPAPVSQFLRSTEPSGANTDPLDSRFGAQRQGTVPGDDGVRDPFARASQGDFSDLAEPTAGAVDDAPAATRGNPQPDRLSALYRMLGAEDASSMETPRARRFVSESAAPEGAPAARTAAAAPGETTTDEWAARMAERPRELPVDDAMPVENDTVAKIRNLYNQMLPKFEEANASAPDVPFDVPPEPFPDYYQRVLTEDPRQLMGAERKVRGELDAATPQQGPGLADLLKGESGSASTEQMSEIMGKVPAAAEKVRYFSMLANLPPQLKNVLGNIGMVGARSAEELGQGNVRQSGNVLKQFFNPQTAREFVNEYKNPKPGRWGAPTGVLGIPGRVMGAVDSATKDALERAGYDQATRELITATGDPRSGAGKWLTEGPSKSALIRTIIPFARTATSLAERGVERTPLLGMLKPVVKMTGAKPEEVLARQALGTGASALGYSAGKANANEPAGHKGLLNNPYALALLGPYALPAEMAYAAGKVRGSNKQQTTYDVGKAAYDAAIKSLPIPTDAYSYDPRNIAASYVPGALPAAATAMGDRSPKEYQTAKNTMSRDHRELWPLAPAIAKIPFLRDLLLRTRRVPRED